ncbi:hypothetical protein VL07_09950 [Bacillus safensis]|nr:hypothetical protein VL07_09950 [Bacillus safensis]KML52345.1 hypothetical protein VL18_05395 [Bacillus safensis]KMN77573.1 hypothetical protein VK99_15615 [Bacillus safensis]
MFFHLYKHLLNLIKTYHSLSYRKYIPKGNVGGSIPKNGRVFLLIYSICLIGDYAKEQIVDAMQIIEAFQSQKTAHKKAQALHLCFSFD